MTLPKRRRSRGIRNGVRPRYFDLRQRAGGRPRRRSPSEDGRLVERALGAVTRADADARYQYVPVDVVRPRRGAATVYLQQRHWGFPVYDGRRSVVFAAGRRPEVTGEPLAVSALRRLVPRATAEQALRAAVTRVLKAAPPGDPRALTPASGQESASAFRWEGLGAPVIAHLAVFVADHSRLAWVVSFGVPRRHRYEVLLDADTLRLLKRRSLSYHATEACLHVGLVGSQAQVALAYDTAWAPPASTRLTCRYNGNAWTPPAPSNQLVCGSGLIHKRTLNALCLASRGLELLEAAGARMGTQTGNRIAADLYPDALADPGDAAVADADCLRLTGLDAGAGYRHAAYDPSVVLHELSHIVLSFNLGGIHYPSPFEPIGESGAVAEGLADFLGLTLWNRIRREVNPAQSRDWRFGAAFLTLPRDYTGYWQSPPVVSPGGSTPHAQGMVLCGALLHALFQVIADGATEARAEEALWNAVCAGLQHTPHQGPLPLFCCIALAVRAMVEPALRPSVDAALRAAGLPDQCPHWP